MSQADFGPKVQCICEDGFTIVDVYVGTIPQDRWSTVQNLGILFSLAGLTKKVGNADCVVWGKTAIIKNGEYFLTLPNERFKDLGTDIRRLANGETISVNGGSGNGAHQPHLKRHGSSFGEARAAGIDPK